jgi:hypothetical protein
MGFTNSHTTRVKYYTSGGIAVASNKDQKNTKDT